MVRYILSKGAAAPKWHQRQGQKHNTLTYTQTLTHLAYSRPIYTQTHIRVCAHTHTDTHTDAHRHKHTQTHTHTHTRIHFPLLPPVHIQASSFFAYFMDDKNMSAESLHSSVCVGVSVCVCVRLSVCV